jgi:hypothetical protein
MCADLLEPTVMLDGWLTGFIYSVLIAVLAWAIIRTREVRQAKRVAARDLMQNLFAIGAMDWEATTGGSRGSFWSGFLPSTALFPVYGPVLLSRKKETATQLMLLYRWLGVAEKKSDAGATLKLDETDRVAIIDAAKTLRRKQGLDLLEGELEDVFRKRYA